MEFTNQLREEGMEMVDALVKASAQRLRPILMTTGAMVLGAVPWPWPPAPGPRPATQIGWVIVGGMSLGTLLTILWCPPCTRCLPARPYRVPRPRWRWIRQPRTLMGLEGLHRRTVDRHTASRMRKALCAMQRAFDEVWPLALYR